MRLPAILTTSIYPLDSVKTQNLFATTTQDRLVTDTLGVAALGRLNERGLQIAYGSLQDA